MAMKSNMTKKRNISDPSVIWLVAVMYCTRCMYFISFLQVYGIVRSVQAGQIEREFVVNQWPDFTALVERPVADQVQL